MLVVVALVLMVTGSGVVAPAPPAIGAVPDEPEALMLPEAPTYQAVAADIDGDGARDVVRLVGSGRDAIDIEAWTFTAGAWHPLGVPVNIVPERPTASQSSFVYAGSPARLIVRRVDGSDRVTLARQPRFDQPALHVECCLLLDDVVLVSDRLRLANVAERMGSADAVLAIDLDGDATDELLVTRGRTPLGDTTFPTDAWVLRWSGTTFAPPLLTELGVGSGHSPFVLGDSDGVPGDEAAFIGAQSRLHRISLRDGDVLVAEDGGVGVLDAIAVPLDGGRGIALLDAFGGLSVHDWPRDRPFAKSIRSPLVDHGDLLGVVTAHGGSELLVRGDVADTLVRLSLPTLDVNAGSVTRSPSAGTLAAGSVPGYVGPLYGGGFDGGPAVIYGGHLVPSDIRPESPFIAIGVAETANLAGVVPIGLVGPDRGWVALWHRALPAPIPDPAGGRLDAPVAQPASGVSLAPVDLVRRPELDDGILDPPISGAPKVRPELTVGPSGFVARVTAPEGSRVYLDMTGSLDTSVVPPSGTLEVDVRPSAEGESSRQLRVELVVVTPAGHGYLAAWNVRIIDRTPRIEAGASTSLGQGAVKVSGWAWLATEVRVAGVTVPVDDRGRFSTEVGLPPWPTSVEIVATDALGNESRLTVTGIGWFDYRGLPWAAIAVIAVALAGMAVAIRVPRARVAPAPTDDAVLEELDPDE